MSPPGLSLRPVEQSDRKLLFEWANDPTVRESAYSTEPISWEEHSEWFDTVTQDENIHLYVAEYQDEPVGQIRFDCQQSHGTVNVSVDKEHRGKGLGTELISKGSRKVLKEHGSLDRLHAWVKLSNDASRRAFEKADYKLIEKTQNEGYRSYHLVFPG